MRKKLWQSLIVVAMCLVAVFACAALAACGDEPAPEPVTYTVTFDVQGHGTAPAAQTVNDGEHATKPATDPTATDWTFGGWYKEAGCTTEFVFASEAITQDTTVYAKWTKASTPNPEKYTVTFNMKGHGVAPTMQTIDKGGKATKPTNDPTADGWIFGGWYKEDACTNLYDFNAAVSDNVIIYAKWTKDETPEVTTVELNIGSNTGITVDAEGTEYTIKNGVSEKTYILTAKKNDEVCTDVIFIGRSIQQGNPVEFAYHAEYNNKVTLILSSTATATKVEGITIVVEEKVVSDDLGTIDNPHILTLGTEATITGAGSWDAVYCKIEITEPGKYDVTEGVDYELGVLNDFGDGINEAIDLQEEELAAGTYYILVYGEGQITLTVTKHTGGAVTPTPETYTVTFNMKEHGVAPATQQVAENGKVTRPVDDPTADGWTFVDWYADSECTTLYDFNKPVTGPLTIYAKWTQNGSGTVEPTPETYTVTFDMKGHGDEIQAQSVKEGEHATAPTPEPSETGWTFGGWYKETGCINEFKFAEEEIRENTTVYAKWTEVVAPAKTYSVTFDMKGHGDAPEPQTVKEGEYATKPAADPTATGWVFGGWYKEVSCLTVFAFASEAITANTTVYAKWTEDKQLTTNSTPTIYLAGDSTVQGYGATQFIAGWGQYLNLFLDSEVTVVNCARGGRSSRSFINEGRLFTGSYSFSENGGKSIEATIQAGDYLFVQFGHNDDDTKPLPSNLYDRMVPLGVPDANGIYPTTAPSGKQPTTYLPKEYTDNITDTSAALTELAKYGSDYYAYDCGGTYKWYLKQYIDLAREKDATPVLITPVARVSFNKDGTLRDGPGLHGDNFAYVQAVRQLAEEEDCLLIDLFADTKDFMETATEDYAKFLMAHVPNSMTGTWPTDYDSSYNNPDTEWQKMEGTHYNKYGAFISAAKVAEHILDSYRNQETHRSGNEYYDFSAHVKTVPSEYLDPSNLISKTKIAAIEKLFKIVSVTNPDRTYPDPSEVIEAIADACTGTVTGDNYLDYQEACEAALALYYKLNIDDRDKVTNYETLVSYIEAIQEQIESHRDKPSRTVFFNVDSVTVAKINDTEPVTVTVDEKYGEGAEDQTPGTSTGAKVAFKIVGGAPASGDVSSKEIIVNSSSASFVYNDVKYTVGKYLTVGQASYNSYRYIEFSTTGACRIVIVSMSGGNQDRTLNLVDADNNNAVIKAFTAQNKENGIGTGYIDTEGAGHYKLGSAGSNIYVYGIIIEVIDHKHSPAPQWHYNGINHWKVCASCGEILNEDEHDIENGACNVCGLKDLTNPEVWDTVETEFNYASAVAQYGTSAAIPSDVTIGKFTVGAGAYFRADNINTQGRNVTIILGGVTNSISFVGDGQSGTKDTYFTLYKGDVDVTPEAWKTLSKAKKEYSVENLEKGTYIIKTSASGGIYNLKVTEVLEKSDPVSITLSGATAKFLVNDAFNTNGLTVTLNHENGSKKILDVSECEVDTSKFDNTKTGKYTITVTYGSFSETYDVTVYSVESITLGTFVSGGASKQTTLQTVYLPNGEFNAEGLSVIATAKFGEESANFILASSQYTVTGFDTAAEGSKTVTITAKANSQATAEFEIVVKAAKTASDNRITITVGKNGTEDFATVTQALQYISLLNLGADVIKTINIADGEYYEKIFVNIPNVELVGSDTKTPNATTDNGVVLWYDALAGKTDPAGVVYGTSGSGSVTVGTNATGFTARNITFKNYYNTDDLYKKSHAWLTANGYKADTQAVALTVSADMSSFYNCKMTSYHDTLLANLNRQYYYGCWIEGRTDYIFGDTAVCFFDDCDIYSIGAKDTRNGGYVVAVRTAANQTYGFIFDSCRFDGNDDVVAGTASLGRPWGADMKMMVMNSTISDKFSKGAYNAPGTGPQGRYVPMNNDNPKAANMLEYNNTGDGAISASIEGTCTVVDKAVADNYKDFTKIFAKGGSYWNPKAVTYTVTVYGEDESVIDTLSVFGGDKITLAQVQEIVSGKIDKIYTSSEKIAEFDFNTAIDGDTSLYVTVKNELLVIDEKTYTYTFSKDGRENGAVEPSTNYVEFVNCTVNNTYLRLVEGSSVKLRTVKGAKVSITGVYPTWGTLSIDGLSDITTGSLNSHTTYEGTATADGYITITLGEGSQATLQTITVEAPLKTPALSYVYDWKGSENKNWVLKDCVDSDSTAYMKFTECYSNGAQYFYINGDKAGACIQVMLPAGATLKLSGIYSGWAAATIGDKVYWNDDHTVADATVEYTNNGTTAELVTVTATKISNNFVAIEKLEVIVPIVFSIGDSVDLVNCGIKIQSSSNPNTAEYKGLSIDASNGKFNDYMDTTYFVQVNANTTISFKVANGLTEDNMTVTFIGSNDGVYPNDGTKYTLTVQDGVATVTVKDTIFIKALNIVAKS